MGFWGATKLGAWWKHGTATCQCWKHAFPESESVRHWKTQRRSDAPLLASVEAECVPHVPGTSTMRPLEAL